MGAAAVGALAARETGTGLYDTILAAYLAARDAYVPQMPNHVFVFTDGLNEDDESITVADLTASLAAAKDPQRPVRLICIGIGPGADLKALTAMASVAGGARSWRSKPAARDAMTTFAPSLKELRPSTAASSTRQPF